MPGSASLMQVWGRLKTADAKPMKYVKTSNRCGESEVRCAAGPADLSNKVALDARGTGQSLLQCSSTQPIIPDGTCIICRQAKHILHFSYHYMSHNSLQQLVVVHS